MGTIDLAIPWVRDGNYFPSLLEPRRRYFRPESMALIDVVVDGKEATPALPMAS